MPSNKVHSEHTKELYGLEASDLHAWLDGPVVILGRGHRKLRHNLSVLKCIPQKFIKKYGRTMCKQIIIDHLILDAKYGTEQESAEPCDLDKVVIAEPTLPFTLAKINNDLEKSNNPLYRAGIELLATIMQVSEVDFERAKEFLNSLTEKEIVELSLLSATNESKASIQALLPFLKSRGVPVKDIVEIAKMVQIETEPLTLEAVASHVNLG